MLIVKKKTIVASNGISGHSSEAMANSKREKEGKERTSRTFVSTQSMNKKWHKIFHKKHFISD